MSTSTVAQSVCQDIRTVEPRPTGIWVVFEDGKEGLIPFRRTPEIKRPSNFKHAELAYRDEIRVYGKDGAAAELPWDFARHFCDPEFEARERQIAERGRIILGGRIRKARKAAGLTQKALAEATGIGRITLVRIERGEQSARFDTLLAIANGLGRPIEDLIAPREGETNEVIV